MEKKKRPLRMAMPDIFEGAEKKKRPASVTVHKRKVEEVRNFFRDVSHFRLFMKDISKVEETRPGVFRWSRFSDGKEESWETELIKDTLHCIAWRTRGEAAFPQAAAVTFEEAPGGKGTVVGYKVAFLNLPGRILGLTERLQGEDPDTRAYANLRRFKALLETGEVPTTEGQPSGRDEAAAA